MLNQQIIKANNKKKIYSLILKNSGISRAQLANFTNLSKSTVSSLVDELIKENHIIDEGTMKSDKQGRRPNSLSVDITRDVIVVLNCHKTYMQIALIALDFNVIKIEEQRIVLKKALYEQIYGMIDRFIEKYTKEKSVLVVCIVVPGIINTEEKSITSTILSLSEDKLLIQEISEKIVDYPVAFFNDTACLAYAENVFGDVNASNYIYLNINEGVGASLIQNDSILCGATGMGTQFGHFCIDPHGELCACGNRGCLENQIGEIALKKRAQKCEALNEFKDADNILFKDVRNLAEAGSKGASAMIDCLAEDLSFGLGNLMTVFHSNTVIIGGKGSKLGDFYLNKVKDKVKNIGFYSFVNEAEICFTTLKEESLFIGAAKYFIDTHYDFMEDMNCKLILY